MHTEQHRSVKTLNVNKLNQMVTLEFELGFPTGRDSATFRDNGTEVSSLSRDAGQNGTEQKRTF